MSEITLVLTRTPKQEFILVRSPRGDTNQEIDDLSRDDVARLYRSRRTTLQQPADVVHYSGRWGTLAMIRGPKVFSAAFAEPSVADVAPVLTELGREALGTAGVETAALPPPTPPGAGTAASPARQYLSFAGRVLELRTDGTRADLLKEYTTMERYRTDLGSDGRDRWIMLHPQPDTPYRLRAETGNSAVQTLRPGHNGRCLRVLDTWQGPEEGILLHEAPDVTWLTGCISPRPKGNRDVFPNQDGNPSYLALNEIFNEINAHAGGMGALFVLV